MAHLAARPRLRLAIEVHRSAPFASKRAPFLDVRSDQICHHRIAVALGIAERPAGYGANVVLELADKAGIDGPMPRIMHARGDLIDQQARGVLTLEHFNAEHADMAQRFCDLARDLSRLDGTFGNDAGRDTADGENAALMHVLDRIVEFQSSVLAADDDDRDLALEGDKALEKRWLAVELLPCRERLFLATDQRLSLAIIAKAPGLQDAGQAHAYEGIAEALLVMHVGIAGHGNAEAAHEVLLNEPVLSDGEGFYRRIHGRLAASDIQGAGRHVLEFTCDQVDARGEGAERRLIIERPDRRKSRHVERRHIRLVGIDVRLEPKPCRGEREQAAELASAQYADAASRRQGF